MTLNASLKMSLKWFKKKKKKVNFKEVPTFFINSKYFKLIFGEGSISFGVQISKTFFKLLAL